MRDDSIALETDRLLLRLPQPDDFNSYARFMADAEAAKYVGGQQARAEAWRGFATICGAWYLQGFSLFSVIEKATGRWVGRVGPWMPEQWPGPEIGWGIVPDRWGHGYATEAAAATIDWVFAELAWPKIIHVIDPNNVASQRVAAKLGSRNQGPGELPPPYEGSIVDIWGQTRSEWELSR